MLSALSPIRLSHSRTRAAMIGRRRRARRWQHGTQPAHPGGQQGSGCRPEGPARRDVAVARRRCCAPAPAALFSAVPALRLTCSQDGTPARGCPALVLCPAAAVRSQVVCRGRKVRSLQGVGPATAVSGTDWCGIQAEHTCQVHRQVADACLATAPSQPTCKLQEQGSLQVGAKPGNLAGCVCFSSAVRLDTQSTHKAAAAASMILRRCMAAVWRVAGFVRLVAPLCWQLFLPTSLIETQPWVRSAAPTPAARQSCHAEISKGYRRRRRAAAA